MILLALDTTADAWPFWERMLERAGLPLVLLILVGVVCLRVARWVRPHVDDLIKGHLETMRNMTVLLDASRAEQKRQADALETLARDMAQQRTDSVDMADRIVDRLDTLISNQGNK